MQRESVLKAWIDLGGQAMKLDRFWERPAELENKELGHEVK